MRYMLYESDNEKIAIEDEIEYIENFIDLQIIRFEKSIKINKKIVFDETYSSDFIESMLLIPFIENAFKHGSLVLKEPEIQIEISIENNILILRTKNKFSTKTNIHGIGLSNVKRRLELLYPNRHELKLDKVGEYFNVYLSIQINK
jgi:LytS/YehU family sensor histidine kinase